MSDTFYGEPSTGEGKKCPECQFEFDRYGERHSLSCSKKKWVADPSPTTSVEEEAVEYEQPNGSWTCSLCGKNRTTFILPCDCTPSSPKDNKPHGGVLKSDDEQSELQQLKDTTNKKCCPICKTDNGIGCKGQWFGNTNKQCVCHQPSATPANKGWEEDLMRLIFGTEDTLKKESFIALESFISTLLATERERMVEDNVDAFNVLYKRGREEGRTETKAAIFEHIECMKPILWNDDPEKHKRNIIAYEVLTDVAAKIQEI